MRSENRKEAKPFILLPPLLLRQDVCFSGDRSTGIEIFGLY